MKRIAILGSTGSIGRQTLDVVRAFPDEFTVVALSAWSNRDLLLEQAKEFHPALLFSKDQWTPESLPAGTRIADSLTEIVTHPDVNLIIQGMVGNIGLVPTLEALEAGKQVAMANKEPIVMAGELLTQAATSLAQYGSVSRARTPTVASVGSSSRRPAGHCGTYPLMR
jgi:1-deoxy-D-xylulose-5-phosphate reductoisomerase